MTKEKIIIEYKKIKKELGHKPSSTEFYKYSNVSKRMLGKAFGSCAYSKLTEACGDIPNPFSSRKSNLTEILQQYGELIRKLEKLPAIVEWENENLKPSVPGIEVSHNLKWSEIPQKFYEFAKNDDKWKDIINKFFSNTSFKNDDINTNSANQSHGHVYLLKHDNAYKIGKSFDVTRRYKEIKVQMPHDTEEIHVIETDDPSGIEAYWHNRFKDKKLKGEWFNLSREDIKAFKKRKFM